MAHIIPHSSIPHTGALLPINRSDSKNNTADVSDAMHSRQQHRAVLKDEGTRWPSVLALNRLGKGVGAIRNVPGASSVNVAAAVVGLGTEAASGASHTARSLTAYEGDSAVRALLLIQDCMDLLALGVCLSDAPPPSFLAP